MKRFAMFLVLASLGVVFATNASAQGTLLNSRIALHLQPHLTKAQCTTNAPLSTACSTFLSEGNVDTAYDMYVVFANGAPGFGFGGAAFGIDYNGAAGAGVDVFSWEKCADLEFPGQGWPADGGGNTITFDVTNNCQNTDVGGEGVQAVLGYFYVFAYSADVFSITPRNIANPDLKVADCAARETSLKDLNRVGFVAFSPGASNQGCNPCVGADEECVPVPVEAVTWGKIKKSYGE